MPEMSIYVAHHACLQRLAQAKSYNKISKLYDTPFIFADAKLATCLDQNYIMAIFRLCPCKANSLHLYDVICNGIFGMQMKFFDRSLFEIEDYAGEKNTCFSFLFIS